MLNVEWRETFSFLIPSLVVFDESKEKFHCGFHKRMRIPQMIISYSPSEWAHRGTGGVENLIYNKNLVMKFMSIISWDYNI